jgi:hypothetical protein
LRYEKRWAKINAFGDTKIPQKLRKCDVCGRRFLSGTMSVERGYVVGAGCIKHIASMLVIGIIIAMTSPGLQKIAPEILEKRDIETQLRDAQYSLDLLLHDLRAEFLSRESKLRQDYLDKVAEITS